MKMIIAIVRPEKTQCVKDALDELGQHGMTITPVKGRGLQSGVRLTSRVGTTVIDEIDKVKFEIVVEDGILDRCVEAIIRVSDTGHIGDGRIFVLPVERSIRIRQSEECQ